MNRQEQSIFRNDTLWLGNRYSAIAMDAIIFFKRKCVSIIFIGFFLLKRVTWAQTTEEMVPFTTIVQAGGWTMVVLGVLSLFATCMVIYFFLTVRTNLIIPESFCVEAENVAFSRNIDALDEICREDKSVGAQIIGSVTELIRKNPGLEYSIIRNVIEDEGGRQANALWQRIQYLMDIAVVAPMVGLLGTVLGMIQAFVGLQDDFGKVKPVALASGVSKALVTTASGLILGIIAMLFYSYFRGRVNSVIANLEERCNVILHHFIFTSTSNKDKNKTEH